MQKYLFLALAILFLKNISAQEQLDSSDSREPSQLKDLNWLMDSTYKVFRTRRFSNMRMAYPSFRTYKAFIDTSMAGEQSEITKYSMYNTYWNRIRIQFTRLMKKTEKSRIDWSKTRLDSFYLDTGGQGGVEYVRVGWIIGYNKKKFLVTALCLKMKDKWFLMDELKFGGFVIEQKKKKKKK